MDNHTCNEVPLLPGRWIPNPLLKMVMENEVVAMLSTNSEGEIIHDNVEKIDSDSSNVGIDNRCSACIYHDINYF